MDTSEDFEGEVQAKWQPSLDAISLDYSQLDKAVLHYLATEGFQTAAEKLVEEAAVPCSYDLQQVSRRTQIRECLQRGEIEEGINLTNNISVSILNNNKQLYFELRLQQLVELIAQRLDQQALDFTAQELAPLLVDDEALMPRLDKVLGLLIFPDPHNSPLQELLSQARRRDLASQVNAAILAYQGLPSSSGLANTLQMLEWTQKALVSQDVPLPELRPTSLASLQVKATSV